MKRILIWSIFGACVLVFIIMARAMFLSELAFHKPIAFPFAFRSPAPYLYSPTQVLLVSLGVMLIVLTAGAKVRRMLKGFLILTGASAAALPVSITLHNLILGLLALGLARSSEPVFFFMAVVVSPIGFMVGAVGSVVLAIKNK